DFASSSSRALRKFISNVRCKNSYINFVNECAKHLLSNYIIRHNPPVLTLALQLKTNCSTPNHNLHALWIPEATPS
ncbi:hypothetical protein STEG23_028657, partial [Scotinomys teguina]